jgi:hydrogenase maturation protease
MKDLLSSILVIGIGNEFRSDDGVGILVARAIEGKKLPGVAVIEQSGEGAALMDVWSEAGNVYLIDAVSSGAPAGTVYRIDARTGTFPKEFRPFSTHAFGVAQAVELARSMNSLPPKLIIFGVEGKNFESGKNLSSEVLRSIRRVTQLLSNEIFSIVSKGPQ